MAPTLTAAAANAMRWDGEPGHYEVWYLSVTDPATGVGLWIRYTMVAPLVGGPPASCSLWFMAMDPQNPAANVGRKVNFPASELHADADPFRLRIGDAELSDRGMAGGFEDVAWELAWEPSLPPAQHVNPFLERAKIAKTVLVLPHPDLAVTGSVTLPDRTLQLDGARGGQAHLWGSKHALRWAWVHCNDFTTEDGEPRPGDFIDGVSVFVPRFGREFGPNTPIVGRFGGRDFASTGPVRVVRNPSQFGLTSWRFEATDGDQRIVGEVDSPREDLVGVTYHDPDGDNAYCYNSEVASIRLQLYVRDKSDYRGWRQTHALAAPGRAHFEYAQREPVEGLTLHVT
jgi:hypothetical protein